MNILERVDINSGALNLSSQEYLWASPRLFSFYLQSINNPPASSLALDSNEVKFINIQSTYVYLKIPHISL